MKITVDPQADALYLRLSDEDIVDSEQVAPGLVLDYDAQDHVVGVEMLHLSKRTPAADLQRMLFETAPGQAVAREASESYKRRSQ